MIAVSFFREGSEVFVLVLATHAMSTWFGTLYSRLSELVRAPHKAAVVDCCAPAEAHLIQSYRVRFCLVSASRQTPPPISISISFSCGIQFWKWNVFYLIVLACNASFAATLCAVDSASYEIDHKLNQRQHKTCARFKSRASSDFVARALFPQRILILVL